MLYGEVEERVHTFGVQWHAFRRLLAKHAGVFQTDVAHLRIGYDNVSL